MKRDIITPEVKDIAIAISKEDNGDWSAYIINNKPINIEMVIIVTQGFSETKKTSLFRHKIDVLPNNSYAKLELIQPELFALDNRFQVSFFAKNTLFDKTYIFKKGTISNDTITTIDILDKKGVLQS